MLQRPLVSFEAHIQYTCQQAIISLMSIVLLLVVYAFIKPRTGVIVQSLVLVTMH